MMKKEGEIVDWIASIAEEKIMESIRKGELNSLPGKGKPLELEDDSMVPEELRVAFKLLKNAGMIPEEMQLRKDLLTLEELLACCRNEEDRSKLQQEWSIKKLRYQAIMAERGWLTSEPFCEYEHKVRAKLADRS
jgi:hypothetical protein